MREIQIIVKPTEIDVDHGKIKQIRIGYIDRAFYEMLGSGEQYDRISWEAIAMVNHELARTLLAEPRDGPYSGGYRVQVSTFRGDSMSELHDTIKEWSEGMFRNDEIFIQEGEYQGFDLIVVTVIQSGSEKPAMVIGNELVLKPSD